MLFSQHYNITRTPQTEWFDPLLERDTKLYVDPFRIYADKREFWHGAHDSLTSFFEIAIGLVGEAGAATNHPSLGKARSLMMFPEPPEFCLGNCKDTIFGSGASKHLRDQMIDAAQVALDLGETDLIHMETLILFAAGMGVDRLSDLVCNVLKPYFIEYTQKTCTDMHVPMKPLRVAHSSWSSEFARWGNDTIELPENLVYPGTGVILTPARFLRRIPTVDSGDFWDFAYADASEELRASMNHDLAKELPKARQARLARRNPDLVRRYLQSLETAPKPAYDLEDDPDNVRTWYEFPRRIAENVPVEFPQPQTSDDVGSFVVAVTEAFKEGVEDKGAWRLLWAENKPRHETIVQDLYRSTVAHYCKAYDVDLSPESDGGIGPVDFKFATGWRSKVLMEMKLTSNTGYWSGLLAQTPAYMRSEDSHLAYFVSVSFYDRDFKPAAIKRVEDAAEAFRKKSGYDIRVIFVDARKKVSASKLKAPAPPKGEPDA